MMSDNTFCNLFNLDDRATMAKKPRDRMEALLDNPNTTEAVQALSPVEFYDLYHGVGPADALALLEYAAPEQIQTCFDLDIWRGDEMSDDALMPWVEQLLTVPDAQFANIWNHTDPEIMALYMHRNLHLYMAEDRNDEVEIPEDESPNVAQSPDFSYWIAYPENPDKAEELKQLVDRLYAVFGVEKAWSILEGMHWEMATDLEETAYRFRTERIRELGFMPRDESAAIFAALDPASEIAAIRNDTGAELYVAAYETVERLDMALAAVDHTNAADSYFSRILSMISDRSSIKVQLVAIAQQIATYDGYQPHESEGFENSMLLGVSYVNLGLEYASGHEDDAAMRILRHIPLKRLVTLGWNITLELRRKAKILVSRGHLSIIEDQPLSLLTNDQRDMVEGMLLERPRPRQTVIEPFVSARDIQSSAAVIADVATRELVFGEGLHKTKDDISLLAYSNDIVMGVENVNFDNVAVTYFVRRAMQCDDPWGTLSPDALPPRAFVLDAVSFDNIRALFKSNMPDTTITALHRYAAQLRAYIEDQWPEQAAVPDPRIMQAMLIDEEE